MRPSQISYIRQKLMNLSKEDLINFAKFNNTWFRPYWPKSEIADAIISGEKENVNIRLKEWAKRTGKEKMIFTPESKEFWKPRDAPGEVDEGKKTFSEEFLERWKKLSSKDEGPPKIEIKMPPRITPPRRDVHEGRPDRRIERPEMDRKIERARDLRAARPPERIRPPARPPARPPPMERPPARPPQRYPVRPPAGLKPPRKALVEPEPARYTPFKTQFEELRKKIVDRVSDMKDPERILKEELVKETEELDRFMTKELELEGIKFDGKGDEYPRFDTLAGKDKKDFDKHLKEIEDKLIVKEMADLKMQGKTPASMQMALKMPTLDALKIQSPNIKYDVHTGKVFEHEKDEDKEIELRSKFFEKYIKRVMTDGDKLEEQVIEKEVEIEPEKPPVQPRKSRPPTGEARRDIRAGRVNGRGLINGVVYKKGLVNGYGYSNGLVNGRVNGKGLINGMMVERTSEEDDVQRKMRRIGLIRSRFRKRIVVTGIIIVFLLIIPVLVFLIPVPDGEGIKIDGNFDDWKESDVLVYSDSLDDQTGNENINLAEIKLHDTKDTVSFYIKVNGALMQGKTIGEGRGMDVARVFIDYDVDNTTGYLINDIGADNMFQISGYDQVINKAEVYTYYPTDDDQLDWNSWAFISGVSAAAVGSEMEVQYWFFDDVNKTEEFRAYFVMQDSDGRLDPSDSVISNHKDGSLSIIQKRTTTLQGKDIDILEYNWVEVLKLEITAYGVPVTVKSIDFIATTDDGSASGPERFDLSSETIFGLPQNEKIQPGETALFNISIKTSDKMKGFMFEIGLYEAGQVDSTADVVSISGLPSRYYVKSAPENIRIDGAFGDWDNVTELIDVDDEKVSNDNINLSSYRFTQDNESVFFQFEVYGTVLGGTIMPVSGMYFYPHEEFIDTDEDGVRDEDDPHPHDASDSDGDTIPDDYEVVILKTEPDNPNTDGDAYNDNLDPAPLDPNIPPLPDPPSPELQVGKDTSIILIDSDQNANTGYRLTYADIGADYMVEVTGKYQFLFESKLRSFNGEDQYDWNWEEIRSVEVAIDEHRLESAINLSDININSGDGFNLFYIISDWTDHRDESTDVFGYEPPGTLRVSGELISPGTRVRNRDTVGILKLDLNSDDNNVRVYSLTIKLLGNFNASDLSRIIIFNDDDHDGIHTNIDSEIDSTGIGALDNREIEILLENYIELKQDDDRTIFIAIEASETVTAGNTVGIEMDSKDDIDTNVKSVIGNFPFTSGLFYLEEASSRAPPTFVNLDLSTTFAGPTSATQGDSGVKVLEFTMTASNGDATVNSITLTHSGNGPASDITNVYLEGPFGNLSGSFGTFSFPPFVVNDTQSLTFKVYFDISITAVVGKFHGVKVTDVGVTGNTRVRGSAKSSEQMSILAIPEIPDNFIPVLAMIVVSFISFKSILKKKTIIKHHT